MVQHTGYSYTYNGRPIESRIWSVDDLERPLPPVSRSRHSLTLNISETYDMQTQCHWNTNGELHTPYPTVLFRVTFSDLEWLSKIFKRHEASRGLSVTAELLVFAWFWQYISIRISPRNFSMFYTRRAYSTLLNVLVFSVGNLVCRLTDLLFHNFCITVKLASAFLASVNQHHRRELSTLLTVCRCWVI